MSDQSGCYGFRIMRITTASGASNLMAHALLAKLPAGRLLNLGAGSGEVRDGCLVVNVDHVRPERPIGHYVVAEAERLPFRPGSFDGALLKDVVEHLQDPVGALRECCRVVRPSGAALVQVPRAIPRAVWADPTHVRGFTSRSLGIALSQSGWRPGRPQRIGGFPGAGRLGLTPHLLTVMRIPVLGRIFGLNWLVGAERV